MLYTLPCWSIAQKRSSVWVKKWHFEGNDVITKNPRKPNERFAGIFIKKRIYDKLSVFAYIIHIDSGFNNRFQRRTEGSAR